MTKPAHDRVTFSGVFGSLAAPVEEWSFSINLQPSPPSEVDPGLFQTRAQQAASLYGTHLLSLFPPQVLCTSVRWASVDGTGHVRQTAGGTYVQGDGIGPGAGTGSSSVKYPLQTALVVTLLSERSGPTGKGRVFLPTPALALAAGDYRISSADAGQAAQAVASLLTALNGVRAGGLGDAVVVSEKGYMSPIVATACGRTLDTQRSRRDRLPEVPVRVDLA